MGLSVHARVVCAVAVPRGVRGPTGKCRSLPPERIPVNETPHEANRRKHQHEDQCEQHARVHVAQRSRETPPNRARPFEHGWPNQAQKDQARTDGSEGRAALHSAAPHGPCGKKQENCSNRDSESALRSGGLLHDVIAGGDDRARPARASSRTLSFHCFRHGSSR